MNIFLYFQKIQMNFYHIIITQTKPINKPKIIFYETSILKVCGFI